MQISLITNKYSIGYNALSWITHSPTHGKLEQRWSLPWLRQANRSVLRARCAG